MGHRHFTSHDDAKVRALRRQLGEAWSMNHPDVVALAAELHRTPRAIFSRHWRLANKRRGRNTDAPKPAPALASGWTVLIEGPGVAVERDIDAATAVKLFEVMGAFRGVR